MQMPPPGPRSGPAPVRMGHSGPRAARPLQVRRNGARRGPEGKRHALALHPADRAARLPCPRSDPPGAIGVVDAGQ